MSTLKQALNAVPFQVVIAALSEKEFKRGKMNPGYRQDFVSYLEGRGTKVFVCTDMEEARKLVGSGPTVLVQVYPEDHVQIDGPEMRKLERSAVLVFNSCEIGPVIADKSLSRKVLSKKGVPFPEMPVENDLVFSNTMSGTKDPTEVVPFKDATDSSRYNTRYIDTRVPDPREDGVEYHTSVRLICVDNVLLDAYVRARDAADKDPNVHSAETPLDPELLRFLYRELVSGRLPEFRKIARQIGQALGPGFYVHDLLIERKTGRVYVCETGMKFADGLYAKHLQGIAREIEDFAPVVDTQKFAERSAQAFLERCHFHLNPFRAAVRRVSNWTR